MAENNAVVRVYDPHAEAEATIKELHRSGFDMNKLSIVGKDYHIEEHVIGYDNAGDRMKVWCQLGDFWGWVIGLAVWIGLLSYPRHRPRHSFWPASQLDCQGTGRCRHGGELSALGAGLHSIGVPKNSIMEYETALKSDKFLLIAHGTAGEMANAKSILERTRAV
jgi:hypothetical protein